MTVITAGGTGLIMFIMTGYVGAGGNAMREVAAGYRKERHGWRNRYEELFKLWRVKKD